MHIRKARPADHPALLRIWREASRSGHPFLGEETLQAQLPKLRDHYLPLADNWVAEEKSLLGFIGLVGNHVGGLFVSPSAHRGGTGRALIEHAAGKCGELTVEVYEQNEGATAFYRRCGFEQEGRKPVDDEGRPLPLLCMRRPAGVPDDRGSRSGRKGSNR